MREARNLQLCLVCMLLTPRARPGTNPGAGTTFHPTPLPTVGPYALPVPGFVPGRGVGVYLGSLIWRARALFRSFFFFITRKPRVERYTKSMRLKYEPASEPLHISVK